MAIAYGVRVGTAISAGPTSLAVPISTAPALTDAIVVSVGWLTATTTVTGVTDTQGNTYTAVLAGAGGTNIRTALWACVAQRRALTTADSITVTFSTGAGRTAIAVDSFSGVASVGVPDQTASAVGTGTTPHSNNTATTTHANELVLGLIGASSGGDTFTPGTGYTALTKVQSGATTSDVTIYPEYLIVAATGVQQATGTLNNSRTWETLAATWQDPQTQDRRASFVGDEVAFTGSNKAASFAGAEVAYTGANKAAGFAGAEVAFVRIPAAASFTGAEVAYAGANRAASFLGAEVAYVVPTVAGRRPQVLMIG